MLGHPAARTLRQAAAMQPRAELLVVVLRPVWRSQVLWRVQFRSMRP